MNPLSSSTGQWPKREARVLAERAIRFSDLEKAALSEGQERKPLDLKQERSEETQDSEFESLYSTWEGSKIDFLL